MAPNGQPAFILYVQTFGDLVTFNPHIHALVADGVFLPSGTFRLLPPLPEAALWTMLRPGQMYDPIPAGRRCSRLCATLKRSKLVPSLKSLTIEISGWEPRDR